MTQDFIKSDYIMTTRQFFLVSSQFFFILFAQKAVQLRIYSATYKTIHTSPSRTHIYRKDDEPEKRFWIVKKTVVRGSQVEALHKQQYTTIPHHPQIELGNKKRECFELTSLNWCQPQHFTERLVGLWMAQASVNPADAMWKPNAATLFFFHSSLPPFFFIFLFRRIYYRKLTFLSLRVHHPLGPSFSMNTPTDQRLFNNAL